MNLAFLINLINLYYWNINNLNDFIDFFIKNHHLIMMFLRISFILNMENRYLC